MTRAATATGVQRARDPLDEALRSLRRAVATVRSYPTGNDLTERTLVDLAARLAPVLPARLLLGPGSVRDASAAANVAIDEGLAALVVDLYRDGVREIRLGERLARPELDRFVAALAAPLDARNLAEDYVTRLWEADLPSVSLVALDPYLDRDIPGDVLEGKQRPSGELEGVPSDLPPNVKPPPEEAFALTELDREHLANEVTQAKGEPPWRAFIAALGEVATSAIRERRLPELTSVTESGLFRLIGDGQIALGAELLRSMLERLPPNSLAEVLARTALEERLAPLRGAVESDPRCHPAARELCRTLGSAVLPSVVSFLRTAGSAAGRRFWAETLGSLGADGLARLEAALREPDPEVAAAAGRVLVATGEPRYAEALWDAFQIATGPSRRELLRAAAALDGASARLADVAVADLDLDCRLIALSCVGAGRNPPLEERLIARIGARDAQDLEVREADALYRALASVGDGRALEFFAKQLGGGWFSRGDRSTQTRAARALARMGSPRSRELLRERATGSSAAAEICKRALREKPGGSA